MTLASTFRRLVSPFVLGIVACIAFAGSASADVPGRVGRIAFLQGDVQFYADSDPNWKAAYVNQPVTSRNSVFTGNGARVEINVGSTTLAMDGDAQVDIQQLDDESFDANVVRGRVSVTVRRIDEQDRYSIAVPGADFALLKPGRYRVDALDDASGITVFSGQASLDARNGPVLINAGSAMRASRDPNDPDGPLAFQMVGSSPVALDDWVAAREERFRASQTARYVSPNMTGYEDLEANGRWANEADIGPVWYPTTYVQSDWVPYRYGRWAYVEPWGYTWVDDAPWASRRSTTVAGSRSGHAGAGCRAPTSRVRCTPRRWSASTAGPACRSRSPSAPARRWAGIRSRRGSATPRTTRRT